MWGLAGGLRARRFAPAPFVILSIQLDSNNCLRGVTLGTTHAPELATPIREGRLTPDIFYRRHRATGAEVLEDPTSRPWSVRQFVLTEPNGYHLKGAESLDPENE